MQNDSFFYFRVALHADERAALMDLARCERRDARAQAAILIRRELERLGLLTHQADASGEQVVEHATAS